MESVIRRVLTPAQERLRAARRARRERLAAARRERLGSAPVIAVTGSATKTTTVKLLAHLLGGPPHVGMSLYANTARDALGQFIRLGPQTKYDTIKSPAWSIKASIETLVGFADAPRTWLTRKGGCV